MRPKHSIKVTKLLFLIFLSAPFFSQKIKADDSVVKKVLIVIGYMDEDNFSEFLEHPLKVKYYPDIAKKVDQNIRNYLKMLTVRNETNVYASKHGLKNIEITVLNPNRLCPGENSDSAQFRTVVCREQIKASDNSMDYLKRNIGQFEQVIYIGHSRKGFGLAIGPFRSEWTFDLNKNFHNSAEVGKLKKIVLASCESNSLFAPTTRLIAVVGTSHKLYIFPDLVSMTLAEIEKLFLNNEK